MLFGSAFLVYVGYQWYVIYSLQSDLDELKLLQAKVTASCAFPKSPLVELGVNQCAGAVPFNEIALKPGASVGNVSNVSTPSSPSLPLSIPALPTQVFVEQPGIQVPRAPQQVAFLAAVKARHEANVKDGVSERPIDTSSPFLQSLPSTKTLPP
jgi:hypothetical protein